MKIVVIGGSRLGGDKLARRLREPGHQGVTAARADEQEVVL